MSPARGFLCGGTPVTFQGNFPPESGVTVNFGAAGAATRQVQVNSSQLVAVAPAVDAAQSVDVTVLNVGGGTLWTSSYTYEAPGLAVDMMALAGLAATSSTERPSGETREEQELRIMRGINAQLRSLPAGRLVGDWDAIWVGLTRDRANLAFIARDKHAPDTFALSLRGTQGFMIDLLEDLDVGTVLPFLGGGNGNVSVGAMNAFTEVVMGTDLCATLTRLLSGVTPLDRTLYVTGHSLGGALATTVSLYLQALGWEPQPFTFAAPTAGDAGFAGAFNNTFGQAVCVYNQYDVIPQAWWNLTGGIPEKAGAPEAAEYFWPGFTDTDATLLVKKLAKLAGSNVYVQPNPPASPPYVLNAGYPAPCSVASPPKSPTLKEWMAELGCQHNDYLSLMASWEFTDMVPKVSGLSPSSGAGGTLVTINSTNVDAENIVGVDFGVVPATGVVVQDLPPQPVAITAVAPPGAGTVDVRVTTIYGTSAAGTRFTYPPPA